MGENGDNANMDVVGSMFDIDKLTKDLKTLVPNIFVVFSIGITLILILYSNINYKKRDIFCFTKQNKEPCDLPKDKEPVYTESCPKDEHPLTTADYNFFELLAYVFGHAYTECVNATSQVINILVYKINSFQIVALYIGFFLFNKFLKEFLQVFVPFEFLNKILNKLQGAQLNSSFIFDIVMSLLSVIWLIFTICLLVAIVVYFAYLFHGLFTSTGRYAQLIPVFAFAILIIPLFPILFSSKQLKKNKYYWVMVTLITLGVPFISSLQSIGSVLVSGFMNLFTSNNEFKYDYTGKKIEDVQKAKNERWEKREYILVCGGVFVALLFVVTFLLTILDQVAIGIKDEMMQKVVQKLRILINNPS
jgi:hypothetical protein